MIEILFRADRESQEIFDHNRLVQSCVLSQQRNFQKHRYLQVDETLYWGIGGDRSLLQIERLIHQVPEVV